MSVFSQRMATRLNLLSLANCLFDARPEPIEALRKKASSLLGVFAARDNRCDAARKCRRPVGLAVTSLIRHRDTRADVGTDVERGLELCAVAGVAAGQMEVERVAVEIGLEVDFGREAATRAAERLALLPPFAPAAETWARAVVLSAPGGGHESSLTRIEVDERVLNLLARANLNLDSVPKVGHIVLLRDTANLSTGGTAIDRTDDIHPENASIARRAALIIGLDVAGIDFIAPDIRRSVRETGGGIVEVNAAPGFRMHLEPFEGWARDIARPVIDMLFPCGASGRIPILAVTGTNGKSTTTRMVAHVLRRSGLTVGFTTTSGIYVDGEKVVEGDASGPKSARIVLRDPTVEAAVLETARGGILREGLGFERCDIGAVLNVDADHIGLKGINSLEDLADVKSVVVEAVRRDGCSVLNADDPLTVKMARHAGGRICFFSLRSGSDMPDALRKHIAGGGLAVVYEGAADGGSIVIHDDGRRLPLMGACEIPATLDGLAEFNVQNALATVAMTYAQGVAPPVIRAALASFASSFEQNPGRLNVYDGHGFRVIVDYAHNPAGLAALCALVRKLRSRYRRTIGMVSIPGDRRDEDIREMGQIAAPAFDEIVFRERPDGRGRSSGEVIRLLSEGALGAGVPPERIHCILDEFEAADLCLRLARHGDLVLLTPASVESVWRQMLAFEPAPDQPAIVSSEAVTPPRSMAEA